jgi:hypothetical protein
MNPKQQCGGEACTFFVFYRKFFGPRFVYRWWYVVPMLKPWFTSGERNAKPPDPGTLTLKLSLVLLFRNIFYFFISN